MEKAIRKENNKTYSLTAETARELSRQAICFSEDLAKTVSKKRILDALVNLLSDKNIYQKVLKNIK